MKDLIKIGATIIGVALLINSISGIENFLESYAKYLELKSMENYTYSKSASPFKFASKFIHLFLYIIIGLILTFKPSVLTNFYLPSKYQENENQLPYKLVISFIYCFGIFLMITGGIYALQQVINQIQYTDQAMINKYFQYSWLSIIPNIVKIIIGFLMYKFFSNEIYSRDNQD